MQSTKECHVRHQIKEIPGPHKSYNRQSSFECDWKNEKLEFHRPNYLDSWSHKKILSHWDQIPIHYLPSYHSHSCRYMHSVSVSRLCIQLSTLKPSINPITFVTVGSRALTISKHNLILSSFGNSTCARGWERHRFTVIGNILLRMHKHGDGVIPKIKQSHLFDIWLPKIHTKRPSIPSGGNDHGLPLRRRRM